MMTKRVRKSSLRAADDTDRSPGVLDRLDNGPRARTAEQDAAVAIPVALDRRSHSGIVCGHNQRAGLLDHAGQAPDGADASAARASEKDGRGRATPRRRSIN